MIDVIVSSNTISGMFLTNISRTLNLKMSIKLLLTVVDMPAFDWISITSDEYEAVNSVDIRTRDSNIL